MPNKERKAHLNTDRSRNAITEVCEYMEKFPFFCTTCSEPFDEVEVKLGDFVFFYGGLTS